MKRTISILLLIATLLSAFSITAFADEGDDNATGGDGNTHDAAKGYAWYNSYQYLWKVTVGEEKGEVHENEEKPNPNGDESNKNADEYQPPAGGDNPFDNDVETEIEDTPVEDLIGDGEDRPGEGTHF